MSSLHLIRSSRVVLCQLGHTCQLGQLFRFRPSTQRCHPMTDRAAATTPSIWSRGLQAIRSHSQSIAKRPHIRAFLPARNSQPLATPPDFAIGGLGAHIHNSDVPDSGARLVVSIASDRAAEHFRVLWPSLHAVHRLLLVITASSLPRGPPTHLLRRRAFPPTRHRCRIHLEGKFLVANGSK